MITVLLIVDAFIAVFVFCAIIVLILELSRGVDLARIDSPLSSSTFYVVETRPTILVMLVAEVILIVMGIWLASLL